MRRVSRNVATLVMALILVLVTGCIPAPGEITPTPAPEEAPTPAEITPAPTPAADRGIIEIRVTDPGVAGVLSANVTAENITIHKAGGGWVPIIPGPVTFDLVYLADTGIEQILGEASIPTANFTGIRMDVIGVDGWTDEDPSREYDAEVPSDKLRIVKPFTVEGGAKTILTLDFDLTKSLVMTGAGKFLFKPVLHVKVAHSSPPETGEEVEVKTQEQEQEQEAEGLEFEGTIEAIDGDTWTMTIEDESWTVDVSEAEIDGEPEVGLQAEVKGTVVDDTIVASEVEIEEEEQEQEQEQEQEAEGLEFEGTIEAIDGNTWTMTIEGETRTVDVSEAEIEGEPAVGLEAEVKGTVVDDTIVASEVEIEEE